ncbi:MAG TPA: DinB family protein [Gemmatimonadales bacterium]
MRHDTLSLIARTLAPPRGRAWHGGPTPVGAVRGVPAAQARWAPAPGRHSIWALTLHIAYWKYAVRRNLEIEPIPRFPRSPANWPAVPERADEAAWRADRELLAEEHRRFARAVERFPAAKLARRPGGKRKWTYGELIIGVLAHDAYHTGQIQLLKRLWRG